MDRLTYLLDVSVPCDSGSLIYITHVEDGLARQEVELTSYLLLVLGLKGDGAGIQTLLQRFLVAGEYLVGELSGLVATRLSLLVNLLYACLYGLKVL